ncbi:hypothetical protein ZWY2020_054372 [Hordeum vulgare]|nr:hypothetical protein ZWY2020_054372 [Hordeum vulgare]
MGRQRRTRTGREPAAVKAEGEERREGHEHRRWRWPRFGYGRGREREAAMRRETVQAGSHLPFLLARSLARAAALPCAEVGAALPGSATPAWRRRWCRLRKREEGQQRLLTSSYAPSPRLPQSGRAVVCTGSCCLAGRGRRTGILPDARQRQHSELLSSKVLLHSK